MRGLRTVLLGLAAGVLACGAVFEGGCVATVGEKAEFTREKAGFTNPSPVTLDVRDDNKVGTVSGVGPARYTSVTEGGIQTLQTGTVNRDAYAELKPDGTVKFNVSSGTDIRATGVEYDPKTHKLKVGEFSTVATDPLKAHAEAYAALTAYWNTRDQASKDAILAQLDTIKAASPEFFAVLKAALGAVGAP